MSPSLHKPTVHHIFSNYFFISGTSAIYVDCNGLFFYSSYDSKVTSGRTRSFRIVRFRENRYLTYGAINIAQHSYHVYNSDGILYRFWKNYTELTLRTAALVSRARRICARTYNARAEKRGGGKYVWCIWTGFVRKRNVISHVILLFSRDCHMIALTLSPQ